MVTYTRSHKNVQFVKFIVVHFFLVDTATGNSPRHRSRGWSRHTPPVHLREILTTWERVGGIRPPETRRPTHQLRRSHANRSNERRGLGHPQSSSAHRKNHRGKKIRVAGPTTKNRETQKHRILEPNATRENNVATGFNTQQTFLAIAKFQSSIRAKPERFSEY